MHMRSTRGHGGVWRSVGVGDVDVVGADFVLSVLPHSTPPPPGATDSKHSPTRRGTESAAHRNLQGNKHADTHARVDVYEIEKKNF